MPNALREELDLRRRRLLDALDSLFAAHLQGRLAWWRHNELVDEVERMLEAADTELLRELGTCGIDHGSEVVMAAERSKGGAP